jgi:hypothetical protein
VIARGTRAAGEDASTTSVVEQTLAAMKGLPDKYRDEAASKLAAGLRRASGRGVLLAWQRLLEQVGVTEYAGPKG